MSKMLTKNDTTPFPAVVAERKTGNEPFIGNDTDFSLLNFWRWAHSDLISNTERGKLAEFIVSMAMHCTDGVSETWGAFDILSPEGIKIEVKTSAYLQSWGQSKLSNIAFGIQETKAWDSVTNIYAETAMRQADVYIFCVEDCKEQEFINPLDLSQWEFYIIPTKALNRTVKTQKSIGLNSLIKIGAIKCGFSQIRETILKIING
jgi:hypothetical protein